MKQKDLLDQKVFKVFPIGRIYKEEKSAFIKVMPDFIKALKHLNQFSHTIIFSGDDEIADNSIKVEVGKLLEIDENSGIIKIDSASDRIGKVLWDIKPYFPCEDRIESPSIPKEITGLKWRREAAEDEALEQKALEGRASEERASLQKASEKKESEQKVSEKRASVGNNMQHKIPDYFKQEMAAEGNDVLIKPIGQVKKTEQETILKLSKEHQDIMRRLKGFSHIKILWWFDKFDKSTYRKITQSDPPYENAPKTGIFASRSPVRPNPIAMTTARIFKSDEEKYELNVSELDALENSFIIDILPYIPAYDRVKVVSVPKWLEHWPQWNYTCEPKTNIGEKYMDDVRISSLERIKVFQMKEDVKERTKENTKKDTKENIKDSLDHLILENDEEDIRPHADEIIIKGARQNNLKNLSLRIPKNKITVITGVSGSGKSSLAFDTIYAESQRRFMDHVSSRMLIGQLEKPDVDQIIGLPPAIAIEQKTLSRNPRSTVGTITDIDDYLKLLYSKIGVRYCPECKEEVTVRSLDQIMSILNKLSPSTSIGISTVEDHLIVDKYRDSKELEQYVKEGLDKGKGAIKVTLGNPDITCQKESIIFQTKEMCYSCNHILFNLTPSTFSFNNPESMCPVCKGLGVKLEVDEDLIVQNPDKSLLDGASLWWGNLRKHRQKPNANWMKGELLGLAEEMKVDLELPWNKLPKSFRDQALYGSNGREIRFTYDNSNGRKGEIVRPVEGAYNCIKRLFRENSSEAATRLASSFMREKECQECHGERLSAEGRLVSIHGIRFPQATKMTIQQLKEWIINVPSQLSKEEVQIAAPILKELIRRLNRLIGVGLPYLSLDRGVPTLSGGEGQRLRLATQLGSGLTNLLYILDEPSMGLHPRDHNKLIKTIKQLRDEGNTVLVVEHDKDTMIAADHIIDIGPGAGEYGGEIIAQGSPSEVIKNPASETGKYLSGIKKVEIISKNKTKPKAYLKLVGAKCNNLKNVTAKFPLGKMTCVIGVSGSGKSSLVTKTLYPALARLLGETVETVGAYDKIEGFEFIDKVVNVSSQPIGRTPRSNPATYTGVFDLIRDVFAQTNEAKGKGYKQNKFSFNSKEGQCEACSGEGRKCVPMHFMPDIWVECTSCHGKRYNKEALAVTYQGKTIADVLDMNIDEALLFFKQHPKINKVLQILHDVGLGYIKLGQSALTLSGGEAQRIKLAKELSKPDTGKTIYLLDEPTTGLHFSDIQHLLKLLKQIAELGNTVILIEHNQEMIQNADWIVELGPEGGEKGGYIITQGIN